MCSRRDLEQLLQQCKEATALCRPWQPSVLRKQLADQYAGVKKAVRDLLARFPGQEQLPVAGLPSAGSRRMLHLLDSARRPVAACAACGKLETAVGHLQHCGACRAVS